MTNIVPELEVSQLKNRPVNIVSYLILPFKLTKKVFLASLYCLLMTYSDIAKPESCQYNTQAGQINGQKEVFSV